MTGAKSELTERTIAVSAQSPLAIRRLLANRQISWGLGLIVALIVLSVLAPILTPFSPTQQDLAGRLKPPGFIDRAGMVHWLGTDQFGRDVLTRLLHGIKTPLIIGFGSAVLGSVIGLMVGVPAGYFGGRIDTVVSIVIDVMLAIPFVVMAMAVIVLFGASALNIILVFSLSAWPTVARVSRAAALGLRHAEFIDAMRVCGARDSRILLYHILPNVLPGVIVVGSVQVALFVIYESAFGFLGLGVPPPEPTWGNMLADARNYIRVGWWIGVFPGCCIALVALAANMLGDGLRDVLDPHGNTRAA